MMMDTEVTIGTPPTYTPEALQIVANRIMSALDSGEALRSEDLARCICRPLGMTEAAIELASADGAIERDHLQRWYSAACGAPADLSADESAKAEKRERNRTCSAEVMSLLSRMTMPVSIAEISQQICRDDSTGRERVRVTLIRLVRDGVVRRISRNKRVQQFEIVPT